MQKTMEMRHSRVLRKLRAGELTYGFKINLADHRSAEIAARSGFDCLWLCQEHIANDWSLIERQVLAAKAYDVDAYCRVSRGGYSDYVRPLELDATGIMVPHVMSLEDAKNIVHMTRFHPVGRRPVDGGNADGGYCDIPFSEYLRQANRERFVVLQIEDPEPMADLEAIAALDGYDILFFGAADYSHALGVPGELNHPEVAKARELVAKMAVKHSKFAGGSTPLDSRGELIDLGYTFINIGADSLAVGEYCRKITSACGLTASATTCGLYGAGKSMTKTPSV